MAGITITLDSPELEAARARISELVGFGSAQLMDDVGALLESSTQDRIATTKRGPNGEVWPAWSPPYAKKRKARHSLLVSEGDLRASYQNYSDGEAAIVGSPLIYAAIHHMGSAKASGRGSGVPARPAAGVSPQDAEDIGNIVAAHLEALLS